MQQKEQRDAKSAQLFKYNLLNLILYRNGHSLHKGIDITN